MEIKGIGKDAEVIINEQGGKQSKCIGRADLLPALSLIAVSKILDDGAVKYGIDNWRKIDSRSHLNHAMLHILAYLAGDIQDDHLGHATCRMMMAHEQHLLEEAAPKVPDAGPEVCGHSWRCQARFIACDPKTCLQYVPYVPKTP